jgi:ribosomal protein L33
MYRAQRKWYARNVKIHFYKNKKNTTERLELKKYNPVLKKSTLHKEIK